MSIKADNQILAQLLSGSSRIDDFDSLSEKDWERLVGTAEREGVAPSLYWYFSQSGELESLPRSARQALRAGYAATWRHNHTILHELQKISALLQSAAIPTVVLKGACFALTIYPDIGLRPMGDLDLMVPKERLAQAVHIAQKLGYQETAPEALHGLNDLISHHVFLQKAGDQPLTLEMHHSLVADKSFIFAVPSDWFWEQTEAFKPITNQSRFEGLFMLTPAAQILYAAGHAMLQHGGRNSPLRWFYDLDRAIRVYADRIDWDSLLSQAHHFEWGSALDAALSQTHACFKTPIPDSVRLSLSKNSDRHQQLVALKQLRPATHMLEERQNLSSLKGAARLKVFFALLIPTPAYMRWRYRFHSHWALPAYYLLRWWVIFKDLLLTLISLLHQTVLAGRDGAEGAPPKKGV